MFNLRNHIKPLTFSLLAGLSSLLLVSCGTQNRAYNRYDGIYATNRGVEQNINDDSGARANYYQQYFKSKTTTYENAQGEDDMIFTDIDAYSSRESLDDQGNIIIEENYYDGYGPWGSSPENISVNIYNYGGYYGFYHRPYYRWYGNYWGYPFYYGNYWNISFGWGYPYYGYYYPYYYGYGYGHYYPFSYPYYYYPNYNYPSSTVSHNRGRRNTDYRTPAVRGRTNEASTRNSSYSRTENTRRINQNNVRANTDTERNINTSPNVRNSRNNTIIRGTQTSPTRTPSVQNQNPRNIRNQDTRGTRNQGTPNIQRNTSPRSQNFSTPSTRTPSSGTIRSGGSGRSGGGAVRSSGGRGRG